MTTATRTVERSRQAPAQPYGRDYSTAVEGRTWRLLALLGTIGVTWIVFHVLTDGVFITPRNLSNLSVQMSITALVAIGVAWLLIAREIDLSSGSLLGLVTVATVYVQVRAGWSTGMAIAVGLLLGMAVGALQGFFTVKLRIPSFIVTLAGFSYLRGAAYVVTGATTLSGTNESFYSIANNNVPTVVVLVAAGTALVAGLLWLRRRRAATHGVGRPRRLVAVVAAVALVGATAVVVWTFASYGGLPIPVAILTAVAVLATYVSRNTAFGRHIYAIGGNPQAARRAGIDVGRVIIVLFIIAGVLVAIGGILQASRLDGGPPTVGMFLALDAISAAVIGGTSLFGGHGSIPGAVLGALLLASIQNGLSLMGVNTFYQYIAIGLILLAAVAIDSATQGKPQDE
jgi:D-xylose transport system permease protein